MLSSVTSSRFTCSIPHSHFPHVSRAYTASKHTSKQRYCLHTSTRPQSQSTRDDRWGVYVEQSNCANILCNPQTATAPRHRLRWARAKAEAVAWFVAQQRSRRGHGCNAPRTRRRAVPPSRAFSPASCPFSPPQSPHAPASQLRTWEEAPPPPTTRETTPPACAHELYFETGKLETGQPWHRTLRVTFSRLHGRLVGGAQVRPLALFRDPFLPTSNLVGGLFGSRCHHRGTARLQSCMFCFHPRAPAHSLAGRPNALRLGCRAHSLGFRV